MLRRAVSQRYGPLWLGIFAVVTFSLFVFVGHQVRDSADSGAAWNWKSVLPGSSSGGPSYQALVHVPDPQTEANYRIHGNYKWYSDSKLRELTACMARGDCPKNADKVLIINVWHCHNAFFSDYWGGEGTWCNSMRRSLERQGYTVLYTYDDWEYVEHIYRQIPDLVKIIIADDDHLNTRAKPHYKTKANPGGIPAWKFFRFNYYQTDTATIVGDAWVITCEPEWREPDKGFRNFTYLGYDLQPDPEHTRVIPFNERPYRAYVLGKHQTFFYKDRAHVAWEHDFYKRALEHLRKKYPDFEFVGSFKDERSDDEIKEQGPLPIPEGIRNMPHLNASQFDYELCQSRMLVGIGWPTASPSPYRALARGVPFLSPYKVRDDSTDPKNPYTWSDSQHDTLRLEKPPRVYNVEEFHYEDFVAAIETAMETPMEPYVYPRMTQKAFDERMRRWMETDWRAEAARILEARLAGHETQKTAFVEVFEL